MCVCVCVCVLFFCLNLASLLFTRIGCLAVIKQTDFIKMKDIIFILTDIFLPYNTAIAFQRNMERLILKQKFILKCLFFFFVFLLCFFCCVFCLFCFVLCLRFVLFYFLACVFCIAKTKSNHVSCFVWVGNVCE